MLTLAQMKSALIEQAMPLSVEGLKQLATDVVQKQLGWYPSDVEVSELVGAVVVVTVGIPGLATSGHRGALHGYLTSTLAAQMPVGVKLIVVLLK